MSKKEAIWRFLLNEALSKQNYKFTQKDIAEKFGFSLSTINNALRVPREIGAVKVGGRYFTIEDKEKFLNLWATARSIQKDIIYATHVDAPVKTIEGQMPAGAVFTAYSGFSQLYQQSPADFDKVYVYADTSVLEELKNRFPPGKGYANLIVLKTDVWLNALCENGIAAPAQLYADLWNLSDWYAKEFLKPLSRELGIS